MNVCCIFHPFGANPVLKEKWTFLCYVGACFLPSDFSESSENALEMFADPTDLG